MYDHEKVGESWLKEGQKLVLESGAPLLPEEIMIRFYVCEPSHTRQEMEQVVSNKITVGEVIHSYYIDTDEIPRFFLLLKNHIFIARSEDTIFIFHV